MKNKSKLPNKPSELIRLALSDLEKVEKTKGYQIDMGDWHEPTLDEKGQPVCSVCFAGAVLAGTLKTPKQRSLEPYEIEDESVRVKLCAIDSLRLGFVYESLQYLEICTEADKEISHRAWEAMENKEFDRKIIPYEIDKAKFKKQMRHLATRLEEAGA